MALKNDFADLVSLLDELTSASNALAKLEASLNDSHLANVRLHVDQYKDYQTRIGAATAGIQAIAARNPQWFEEKKTLSSPFGDVKRTTSTSLVVADPAVTITLIKAARREEDFLKVETTIRLEALEPLADEELRKFGVRRETKHNFKPEPATVDLGKAVKAAEKGDKPARGAAKKALAGAGAALAALVLCAALWFAPTLQAAAAPRDDRLGVILIRRLLELGDHNRTNEQLFTDVDPLLTAYFRGRAEGFTEAAANLEPLP